MTLIDKIEKDYLEAYKAKKSDLVGVLRLLKAAIKNRLVDLKRPGGELNDEETLDVILKQAKQREDSIEQYTSAGRKDLAEKEALELSLLQKYLPQKLTKDELILKIREAIHDLQASGPQDMGKIISHVMTKFKGRADGKDVANLAKELLSKK